MTELFVKALELLIRPIIRFAVRYGITVQIFERIVKQGYVAAAIEAIEQSGESPNASRVAVITGLTRRDVNKLRAPDLPNPSETMDSSVIARILAQWEQDPEFKTRQGAPRVLSADTMESEFSKLVQKVNSHVRPGAVLFELRRTKRIEDTPRGVRLVRPNAVVQKNELDLYRIASDDIATLLGAVERNMKNSNDDRNLHMRTFYDNVFLRDLPQIQVWIVELGKEMHRRVREYVANFDKDLNPSSAPHEPAGGRIAFSTFALTEPMLGPNPASGGDGASGGNESSARGSVGV